MKRGETEYGIAAIPAGGYVKISGMNPDDVLPEGEEHRGYYEMPVWKRIVVIGAGPAVNIVLAFAILSSWSASSPASSRRQVVGEIRSDTPGRRGARERRPDPRGRRQTLPRPATLEERIEALPAEIGTHDCAGKQAQRLRRDDARRADDRTRRADADADRVSPNTTRREAGADRLRLRQRAEGLQPRGAAGTRGRRGCGSSRRTRSPSSPTCSTPKQRKEVSGVVGTSDVANETINEFGATEGARSCSPSSASPSA